MRSDTYMYVPHSHNLGVLEQVARMQAIDQALFKVSVWLREICVQLSRIPNGAVYWFWLDVTRSFLLQDS